MKKKFLALVMTLSMVLSLVPMTALAAEEGTAPATQEGQSVGADAAGNSTEGDAATSGSPGEDQNPGGNDTGDSGNSEGDAGNENTSGNDADSSTNPDASGGNDASEGEAGNEGEGSGETGNEGDSGDSNIEYPEETCTVDYSKQQSSYVTLSEVTGYWKTGYEVTYTITEDAPKDLVIDFTQAYELCVEKYRADSRWYFGPGDSIKVKIKIVNNSSNDYIYINNSFVSAPQDTTLFGSIEEGNVYPALTYDGQLMPIALSTALLTDYFYDDLFGKERANRVSFLEMCQLYEKLEENGYTGENALSDYLVHHFNKKFGETYESIESMAEEHPDWLLNGGTSMPYTSTETLTNQELETFQKQYPQIAPFFNAVPSRNQENSWSVNIKWPETKCTGTT